MLSSLSVASSLVLKNTGINYNPNVLLGQTQKSQNTSYGISSVNFNKSRKYHVLTIYGSVLLNGSTKSGIWVSNDYGQSFIQARPTAENYTSSCMSSSGKYIYVNCQNVGKIFVSYDYGQTFILISIGTNISDICCSNNGSLVFFTDYGTGDVWRSTDYGSSFAKLINIPTSTGSNLGNILYNENLNCIFYTSSANGNMYKYNLSNNTYSSYKPNSGGTNCSGVAFSYDGKYIYLSYYGVATNQICRSSDFGATWSLVTIPTVTGSSSTYAQVLCSPNGQYVYTYNYGTHLYYSSNYGATWSSVNWSSKITSNLKACMSQDYSALFVFDKSFGYVQT